MSSLCPLIIYEFYCVAKGKEGENFYHSHFMLSKEQEQDFSLEQQSSHN